MAICLKNLFSLHSSPQYLMEFGNNLINFDKARFFVTCVTENVKNNIGKIQKFKQYLRQFEHKIADGENPKGPN